MHFNSKDIIGAMFCIVLLGLALCFIEPGINYYNYLQPALGEIAQTEKSIETDNNLLDREITYANNQDTSENNQILAPQDIADQVLDPLDIDIVNPSLDPKDSVATDSAKSSVSSSKIVVQKPDKPASVVTKTESAKNKTSAVLPKNGSRIGDLIPWSEANRIFAMYDRALITDVETGLSFGVQRRGGSKHADSQPLTAEDTDIMKKIYGGQWSWERRAIVVTVDGRNLAASMNGMPHAAGAIQNNNFDGHFCIHFLNSRTHGSNQVDAAHQAMIQKAAGK